MKILNSALIVISLVAAGGCMNNRMSDQPQGGATSPEFAGTTDRATTMQATAPPQTTERAINNLERADKLIGEAVLTSDHQRAGKLEDFVVDQDTGHILYAIVGIGGVLGVGETRVAVPATLFTEARKGSVQVNVDKAKLTRAPQVTRDTGKEIKADYLSNVYGYYGQTASWQGTAGSAASSLGNACRVSELHGMKVVNNAQQTIGKVETIALDVPKGRELFVVISPSSDLNLGNDYYALPPQALKLNADAKALVTDVTREKLSSAPHFAKDDWSELSDMAWAQKVYQYYGQPATFQTEELQPTGRTLKTPASYQKR
jgi:sporulation protein YlmC with PRC-barrel domain